MVIGDQKKYLTGIISIEKERFQNALEDLGLDSSTSIEELSKSEKIKTLIQRDMDKINKNLASFETIKKFYIAPEEFTVEGGHLTPSLKLKKKIILEKYEEAINAMY